jgi:hypothetical protein
MKQCGQCSATKSLNRWDLRVCADGRRHRVLWLCDACDSARNREMLVLLRDPKVDAKMARYEARA